MDRSLTATGLEVLGDQPWGSHLCVFYETVDDLLEMAVPYLQAGLRQNEQCVWVASAPDLLAAAQGAVAHWPDLARGMATGQLALHAHSDWYVAEGELDSRASVDRLLAAAEAALAEGRAGLRLVGDNHWLSADAWPVAMEYEAALEARLRGRRIVALCAYGAAGASAAEVFEVIERHHGTLARRRGVWSELGSSALRRAHAEIRALNDSLEQRVAQRTAELTAANAQLAYQAELLASIHDAVIATDEHLKITAWNPAAEAVYGWTQAEVLGRNLIGLLGSEIDTAGRQAALETALKEGEFRAELWQHHKDGTPLFVETVVRSLRDPEGRFRGLVGANRDITARMQAQTALRQQKEVLQTIFDNLPVLIATIDEAGRLTFGNRAWDRVYGWTVAEVGVSDLDILAEAYPDPADLQRVRAFIQASTGEWADFKTRVRDGRVIDTSWAVVPLPDGTRIHIGQDITERKRAEAAAAQAAARTEALLRVARRLSAQLDLAKVIETVCAETARVMALPIATVLLLNEQRDRLEYVSGVGMPPDLAAGLEVFPVQFYQDQAGDIEPMVTIPDAAAVPDMPNAWVFGALDIRTVVAVTLYSQDQPLGALSVATVGEPRQFDEGELELLRGLADLSALAIHNSLLYRTVSEHRERLRALSAGLVEAQEAERRHIARELHDEVGQLLTGLQLTLAVSGRQLTGPARTGLDKAQKLVTELMDRAQDLSLDLRPPMLDDLGLVPALLWHFEHYTQQTGVRVRFEHNGADRRFAPEVETTAYRIIQAALTNVARHARVDTASVRVWANADWLNVQVEDGGAGFEVPQTLAAGTASGLNGMRERAALVGGHVLIESARRKGTQITAELPVGEKLSAVAV